MTEKIRNPYRQPFHQWPAEVLAAYQSFPKHNGMNAPICDETWPQWRKWALEYKDRKDLWPAKLHEYIAERKRRETIKDRQGQ